MKQNPAQRHEERDKRIYEMYKKGAYTFRGLARLFRLSHPRIIAIVQKEKKLAEEK